MNNTEAVTHQRKRVTQLTAFEESEIKETSF